MKGPAALLESLVAEDVYGDLDLARRARVLAAACLLVMVVGFVRGSISISAGALEPGMLTLSTSALSGAVLLAVRRGARLVVTAQVMIALMFMTCVGTAISRGGVGSPVLVGLGVTPLLVTLILGWRKGLMWLAAALLTVGALSVAGHHGMLERFAVIPTDTHRVDFVATLALVAALFLIGSAFEWSRDAALSAKRTAELEKALAESTARLLQSDRMASIGVLAAGVGHEVNNPLAYVLGNLNLLHEMLPGVLPEGDEDTQIALELVQEAEEGAERIRHIVKDLRSFTRVEPDAEPVPFRVERALEAALSLTRGQLKHHARVHRDFARVPRVMGEEFRLVQVLVNLLINAAHAVRDPAALGTEVFVELLAEGGQVVVRIRDQGPGIAAEHLDRIFEPFFTTRGDQDGTGLGLAVSRQIVHEMDGSLHAISSPGAGATFELRLPAAQQGGVRTPAEVAQVPMRATGARVLVVDDEPRVSRTVSRMLVGCDVREAHSAEEALGILEDWAVDLVICDLMMPGISGTALHAAVAERSMDLAARFVFITGGVNVPETQAYLNGLDLPVLGKPLDRDRVRALVDARHIGKPVGLRSAQPAAG